MTDPLIILVTAFGDHLPPPPGPGVRLPQGTCGGRLKVLEVIGIFRCQIFGSGSFCKGDKFLRQSLRYLDKEYIDKGATVDVRFGACWVPFLIGSLVGLVFLSCFLFLLESGGEV